MMDGDLEYAPSLALTEAREQNERLREANMALQKLVLVPGEWKCLKCGLQMTFKVLNTSDGSVGMDESGPHICPNNCGLMEQVTEREWGIRMGEASERYFNEAQKLRSALEPFANFACAPGYHEQQGEALCHNCIARAALAPKEASNG